VRADLSRGAPTISNSSLRNERNDDRSIRGRSSERGPLRGNFKTFARIDAYTPCSEHSISCLVSFDFPRENIVRFRRIHTKNSKTITRYGSVDRPHIDYDTNEQSG